MGTLNILQYAHFKARNDPLPHAGESPRIPREELTDGTFRAIWGHGNVDFKQV